jgi:glycosyltransferase involved in cell wall biosynthesis
MEKLDLSLIIITLNEEKNIKKCIESVPFASEVIVVDSGSSDKTIKIAKSLGAKVYHQDWLGYGLQKQFALDHASKTWVLSLDADEELSTKLQDEIIKVVKEDKYKVFKIKRLSFFLGRFIYHSSWGYNKLIRLFKKGYAKFNKETVHEKIITKENFKILKNLMYHTPFESIEHQLSKNLKYANLVAEKKFKNGKRVNFKFSILLKTVFKFFEVYFLKLGILDGFQGFVISINSAQSYMIQFHKIYKLTKKEKK